MIRTTLMPHQKLASDFAVDKEYAGLLLPYGTGKTLVALDLIDRNKWKRVVVVSTKTAITSTWPDEIEKHSTFRYCLLIGTAAQKVKIMQLALDKAYVQGSSIYRPTKSTMMFLVNFDGVRNIYDYLVAMKPDAVFCDESTKIKSSRTHRTKVIWALGEECKHRFIMTGWPTTEGIQDVYSQIRFLDGGKTFGRSFLRFRQNYFFPSGFKWVPKRKAEEKIMKAIRNFCIMVPETVIKLPPKVYVKKPLIATAQQRELFDGLKAYFQLELGKVKIDTDSIFTLLAKSLQICDGFVQDGWYDKLDENTVKCRHCGRVYDRVKGKGLPSKCQKCGYHGTMEVLDTPKDEALVDVLESIGNEKVLIWTNFRWTSKKLARVLTRLGHGVLTLSGETEDPGAVVKAFQHGTKYDILVATLRKASESVTLTAARNAIYYSNNWSYDLRGNSEARIRRKGSEKHANITYTDFFIKDSVEQLVYDCLRDKENIVKRLKKYFV